MTEVLADLVLLSNGPGELSTWVRPVLQALRARSQFSRVSILLSPCPHAGGHEAAVAATFPGVDRVLEPQQFFPFLLWGKTPNPWQWHPQGVVVFLGGDQFYAVAIGKRLGYRIVTYAEWTPRWLPWIDACGVTQAHMLQRVPRRYRSKVSVVGHLMTDIQPSTDAIACLQGFGWDANTEIVGLLPGSKPAKLRVGVPFCLGIADQLHHHRPQTQFVIPVAPGVSIETLKQYADPTQNALISKFAGSTAVLNRSERGLAYLCTPNGTPVWLWPCCPAYDLFRHCQVCVTTVGANTAELTALAIPMLVVIPTQQLEFIRVWDGGWGLVTQLPLVGTPLAALVNRCILSRGLGLKAWPNIWAGQEIVPEHVGQVYPDAIAQHLQHLLNAPTALQQMQTDLRAVRGKTGAATRLARLIENTLAADPQNASASL
ncbi:lipid-A-disaccharide synthase [Acaryochloris sp. IP29b_bin.148]|uniref:lipid-A-disaccharide synthase n=1 Tax=Acaryochloris sp. IP29b_bin.148 TaxID=2969218 RepID=UPI00260F9538|nr:lipid-A-disaccharide synthase [Acaryochloris sp. IP29b_bin.148]